MKPIIALTLAFGLLAGCAQTNSALDTLKDRLDAASAWIDAKLEDSYAEAAFTSAFGLVYLGDLNERLCTDQLDGEWVQLSGGGYACDVEDWPF